MLLAQYHQTFIQTTGNNDFHQSKIIGHSKQRLGKQIVISPPTESQINQYMKKTFLQTYESNSHVDKVRMNYIKLKNKKNPNNSILDISQQKQDKSILNESVKNSGIGDYLRQLQEDSKKTNLPQQIINNKALCSLYQKLDLFENNIISQHEKEQKINKTSTKFQQQQSKKQTLLNKDQLQWQRHFQQILNQAKEELLKKQSKFYELKEIFIEQNRLQQFQQSNIIKKSYIESLLNQTQSKLTIKREKLDNLQQQFIQLQSKQIKNIQMDQRVQQLTKQLKDQMCELYIKQNMF